MRRLALLPVVLLAFACGDSTILQPEQDPGQDPEIVADRDDDRGRRTKYTFQFRLDEALSPLPPPAPDPMVDGDFLILYGSNAFVLEGELEGHAYLTGGATLDQNTGLAKGTGSMLLILNEPGVGSFTCTWSARWEEFFAVERGKWHACKGFGYFKGMKLYSTNNNQRDPEVSDAVAWIRGGRGDDDDGDDD